MKYRYLFNDLSVTRGLLAIEENSWASKQARRDPITEGSARVKTSFSYAASEGSSLLCSSDLQIEMLITKKKKKKNAVTITKIP